jgi:hypothetical protein
MSHGKVNEGQVMDELAVFSHCEVASSLEGVSGGREADVVNENAMYQPLGLST